jgi:hypothetical protein
MGDGDEEESAEEAGGEEPLSESINSADPASVARASRRARTWLAQRRAFWRAMLSTEIGRRSIWEFLTIECNFGTVPVANSPAGFPDAAGTMFWIGATRVGARFYDMLQRADHEAVYLMRVENDPEFSEIKVKR